MSNETLNAFLHDLDIVNNYCNEQEEKYGFQAACSKCVLNDHCFDIPTRSSVEFEMRVTHTAAELIKRTREGEGEKS